MLINKIPIQKLIYFLILFLIISCENDIDVDFDYNQFKLMRQKWQKLEIKNYSFNFSSIGYGSFSNRYIIKNNLIAEVCPDTNRYIYDIDTVIKYTLDDIFKLIESRYKNPIIKKYSSDTYWYCYKIKVEYDSVYFFPKQYEFLQDGKNIYITDMQREYIIDDFRTE